MAYQQMSPEERMSRRRVFGAEANRWRQCICGRLDEVRADLASRWQQWSECSQEHEFKSVTWTKVSDEHRKHTKGNLWWNQGEPPKQATLALKRGDTSMNKMFQALEDHPLVVDSNGDFNLLMLDGKVNARSSKQDHESEYNVKFTTVLGFNLTVGYSRHKDPMFLSGSHAWVAFGEGCTEEWHRELSVNLLLNIVGYKSCFPDVLPPPNATPSRWRIKQLQQQPPPSTQQPPPTQPPPIVEHPTQPVAGMKQQAPPPPQQQPQPMVEPPPASSSAAASSAAAPVAAMAPLPPQQQPQPMVEPPPESSSAAASSAAAPVAPMAPPPPQQEPQPMVGPPPASSSAAASSAAAPVAPLAQPLAGKACLSAAPQRAKQVAWASVADEENREQSLVSGIQTAQIQPLAGAPIAGQQVEQTHQPAGIAQQAQASAAHQTQPLAGADDEDDHEWEDLDNRAVIGEGGADEERETAERFQDATVSEAEDMAFKLKVAAVVRKSPKARRFAITPHSRFRPPPAAGGGTAPAVGGGAAVCCIDINLHMHALRLGEGVRFTLESLRNKDENGRWFVAAMAFAAVTRRYEIVEEPRALCHSWHGGWKLIDELPDTDQLSGAIMDSATFASRWQQSPALVLKHLLKKHEGELVELEGWWLEGTEEFPPDELFDAQFASNDTDFSRCKELDKGASMDRSRYSGDYRRGKGKRKGKPAVGEPAVGSSGKGPAVGGKGKSIMDMTQGQPFTSNVLQLKPDGTWYARCGTCMSLAHLFAKLGERWTAAKLYEYYNICRVLACKRQHPWASPWRQQAAIERYKETGRYGHYS